MTTRVVKGTEATAVTEAAAAIAGGELVVLPTDTVYGVGTRATDARAIINLYAAKQRPDEKGIPLLLSDAAEIERVARDIPGAAWPLIERFWPGPLTLILPRRPELPAVLSNSETIAVRMPDHELTRAVIRQAGGFIAMTSANRSGRDPAQTALEALEELGGVVTVVVDGGPCRGGLASTVLDCTTPELTILRAGPLSAVDLGLAAS